MRFHQLWSGSDYASFIVEVLSRMGLGSSRVSGLPAAAKSSFFFSQEGFVHCRAGVLG
jgi:hypothetical protein